MATRRKKDLSGSSVKDSDFLFDYTCAPCTKDGLNNEAINYCVDCTEYFCGACTKQHKKFGGTSDHNVVNRTLTERPGGVPPPPVVHEACREHHGERLTTYCADHDLVVCNTCVAVDHRLCGGVSYIQKVAGSAKQSKTINKVKKLISDTLQTNGQTNVSLQRSLTSADQGKKDHNKRVHDYTKRLIKHARDLEKAAIRTVDDHHKIATEHLKAVIRSLDDSSTTIKTRLGNLNSAKKNSKAQVFVDYTLGSQEVKTARQLQQDVTPYTTGKALPEFVVSEDVEYFLNEVRSLGQFTALEQLVGDKALGVELLGKYNVHMPEDQHTCGLICSCELHDGAILIADVDNMCLKKLSKYTYKVIERLDTPVPPESICRISDDEVAVTLTVQKRVQFVNVAGRLRLASSFQVTDFCRDVVCSRDEIFVSCGGRPGTKLGETEGPALVAIYDLSGSPLRTIQFDNRGRQLFSFPLCMTASASGDKLHISDIEGGVITVDRQGRVLSMFSQEALQGAVGLCTVTDDNVLAWGYNSLKVVQLGPGGDIVVEELLTGKDDIKDPVSVCPIRDNSRMILTEYDSNTIKVCSFKS